MWSVLFVLGVHARTYRLMTWAGILDAKKFSSDSKVMVADADRLISEFAGWVCGDDLTENEKQLAKPIGEMLATYRNSVA